MSVTRRFSDALNGGHLSEILDVATRGALAAWEVGEPEELEAALDLLRDAAPDDPPVEYDPTSYIEANEWVFAKTMPKNPHEYLLLRRSTDWREHLRFVRWLRVHGEPERFGGQLWPYRTVGEWRYWAGVDPNWTIVNRRREQ